MNSAIKVMLTMISDPDGTLGEKRNEETCRPYVTSRSRRGLICDLAVLIEERGEIVQKDA